MENSQNKKFVFEVGTNWKKQAEKLKEKFNQLTDSDLKFENGKEVELLTRVESKLNKKREEVVSILNEVKLECEKEAKSGTVS